MKTRQLGQNGPMLSTVSIGGMSFSNFYGETNEQEAFDTLETAIELGINHIDTANVYGMGQSESAIGNFLAKLPTASRDFFSIATKASINRDPDTGERSFNNSAAHLESELDKSLKRLGVDHVELFYVHRRDTRLEIEDVTETLAGMIKSGKIGAFGFSEIAPSTLMRAAAVHPVAAVQSEYSLSSRIPELGMLQACETTDTTFVAFSPVGRGILTDTPPTGARIAAAPFLVSSPRFMPENLQRNIQASQPFRELAADLGIPTAALAIAWVLDQSKNIITIPGTRNSKHLREVAIGAGFDLTSEVRDKIKTVLPAGWAHGPRYSAAQAIGPEDYC